MFKNNVSLISLTRDEILIPIIPKDRFPTIIFRLTDRFNINAFA
jgi:hypothetical protein